MKNAVLVTRTRRKLSGPIPRSLIRAAKELDCYVGFIDDDVSQFDNVVVFTNNLDEIPEMKTSANIGWWMCDLRDPDRFETPKTPLSAVFLCNTGKLSAFADHFNTEAFYMPRCGPDQTFPFGRHIEWDSVFIGNVSASQYHSNRPEIVQAMEQHRDMKLICGNQYTRDQTWIYNQTPVSLAVSMPVEGYTSNRLYNILASEGLCLTLYYPGIEKLFENKKHLVWFHDKDEALALAKYYIEHKEERDEIARQGKILYDTKHTAKHRLQNMLDILSGETKSFNGFL